MAPRPDPFSITIATDADAVALAALKARVAASLTARHGKGHWSSSASDKAIRRAIEKNTVLVAQTATFVVGTLSLQTKKPWAINLKHFTAVGRALYLVDMAVDPHGQGGGVGRVLIQEAVRITRGWPADAIRLDAYDSPAGAGGFYAKCGFTEVGRAVFRTVPLIYFEYLL